MGAKNKLNSAYLNGAVICGAMAGLITGSWTVFAVASIVLVGTSIVAGEIRGGGSGGGQSGSPRSTRRHDR